MHLNIGSGDTKIGNIRLDQRKTIAINIQASAKQLPFKNSSFDKVSAIMVLEHVDKPFMVLEEAKRVLKTQGIFYGEVPWHSKMTFYQFKQLALLRFKHAYQVHCDLKKGEHKWQFDVTHTTLFMESLGFKNVSVQIIKQFPYLDGKITIEARNPT